MPKPGGSIGEEDQIPLRSAPRTDSRSRLLLGNQPSARRTIRSGNSGGSCAGGGASESRCTVPRWNVQSVGKNIPFCIVYEIREDEIIVLAIAPFSRNPRYWRERKIDE